MAKESVLQKIEALITLLDLTRDDCQKFEKGNGAAGTRIRTTLMDVKKSCDTLRKEIQTIKNRRAK